MNSYHNRHYISDFEKSILLKEKRRKKLKKQIKLIKENPKSTKKEKEKIYIKYKEIKKELKEILFTPTGVFNYEEYGHLLKNSKLNLELLNLNNQNK